MRNVLVALKGGRGVNIQYSKNTKIHTKCECDEVFSFSVNIFAKIILKVYLPH